MRLGEESFVAHVQSESDIAAVQCSEEEWTVGEGVGKETCSGFCEMLINMIIKVSQRKMYCTQYVFDPAGLILI